MLKLLDEGEITITADPSGDVKDMIDIVIESKANSINEKHLDLLRETFKHIDKRCVSEKRIQHSLALSNIITRSLNDYHKDL
jgi:hypothetical protein